MLGRDNLMRCTVVLSTIGLYTKSKSDCFFLVLQRNHSSLNTFKCYHCCSKFSTSSGRIRHLLRCHKKGRTEFKHGKERKVESNKLKMKLMVRYNYLIRTLTALRRNVDLNCEIL